MKQKLFKLIHNNPVEIYMMWTILALTIFVIFFHIYSSMTDYTETYQFIKNL